MLLSTLLFTDSNDFGCRNSQPNTNLIKHLLDLTNAQHVFPTDTIPFYLLETLSNDIWNLDFP